MKKVAPSEKLRQSMKTIINGTTEAGEDTESLMTRFIILGTKMLMQEMLEKEQEEFLQRSRYERSEGFSKVYRNGYEPGKIKTAEGIIDIEKPQVRGCEETYRSELADRIGKNSGVLERLVLQMYSGGMSVRDVERALNEATGTFILSDSSVSEITKRLYEDHLEFISRDLSAFDVAYMFVDSVYEPLRRFNAKKAIICAWGIQTDGSRVLLGFEQFKSESTEAYMAFFEGLKRRNLNTPMTVTTDGAMSLISAVEQSFPRSLRIRCWFHKMQNLQAKVPDEVWPAFKEMVLSVRDASTARQAAVVAKDICDCWSKTLPGACKCLMDDFEASVNHLNVLSRHRALVRTNNLVERSFVEQRRRTKVIPHLWTEDSMERLFLFVMKGVENRWSRRQFNDFEQKMVIKLRKDILERNLGSPYVPSFNNYTLKPFVA